MSNKRSTRQSSAQPPPPLSSYEQLDPIDSSQQSQPTTTPLATQHSDYDHQQAQQQLQSSFTIQATPALTRIPESPPPSGPIGITTGAPPPPPPPPGPTADAGGLSESMLKRVLEEILTNPTKQHQILGHSLPNPSDNHVLLPPPPPPAPTDVPPPPPVVPFTAAAAPPPPFTLQPPIQSGETPPPLILAPPLSVPGAVHRVLSGPISGLDARLIQSIWGGSFKATDLFKLQPDLLKSTFGLNEDVNYLGTKRCRRHGLHDKRPLHRHRKARTLPQSRRLRTLLVHLHLRHGRSLRRPSSSTRTRPNSAPLQRPQPALTHSGQNLAAATATIHWCAVLTPTPRRMATGPPPLGAIADRAPRPTGQHVPTTRKLPAVTGSAKVSTAEMAKTICWNWNNPKIGCNGASCGRLHACENCLKTDSHTTPNCPEDIKPRIARILAARAARA
ncbi:hypothetical protein BJ508DRAFT_310886 [Ascobolus immersus RN42]|uniref:Uncharacterized protein n=1 Tax=Ascobolus immersus RN42 TaxID=1160509 RepID=A0A3N4HVW1_ASCIM|nr:hypothetical protein BJ508DRAFT_310886 [Ascobolus immersus RN42]